LKAAGLQTDRICTSPLRRARETAEIAAKVLKIPRLEEWDELKPDGSKAELYRKLARLEQNSRPILVGHEPYLTSMIGEIIGTTGAKIILKKGGLGKVRITSFTLESMVNSAGFSRRKSSLRCLDKPKTNHHGPPK